MRVISKAKLTTISLIELDLTPGNVAYDEQGRKYIKVKAAGIIAADIVVYAATTAAIKERGYLLPQVIPGAVNKSDNAIGWNKTGKLVVIGAFYWCMVGPIVEQVVSTGAITTGAPVYTGAIGALTASAGTEKANVGTALTAASGNLVDVLRRDG